MVAAFLVFFMGAALFFLQDIIFGDKSSKKRVIHEISLMKPPPPPPPPKPEEKPPEPEIKKEEVKIPEPEAPPPEQQNATQDEPPPSDNLGLDADGQAGSDGFGLSANKGGRAIIAKSGGGGNRFAWYDGLVQKTIQDVLDKNKDLDNQNYKVVVKIWLNPDGTVERFDLASSSGNVDVDKSIKIALREVRSVREPLPDGLAQPIKLRITSRQL
jgi:periplasmic protein TonB